MTSQQSEARSFSASLHSLLASQFGARLAGSWATAEGHWPPGTSGVTNSFSDVDVLLPGPAQVRESAARIRDQVGAHAKEAGIAIDKISVRSQTEIGGFWCPRRVRAMSSDPLACGQYLLFWALVGSVEAFGSAPPASVEYRSYAVVKFFFKIGRNLILAHGGAAGGYREAARQMENHGFDRSVLRDAYAIKLGHAGVLHEDQCAALLCSRTWRAALQTVSDGDSASQLESVKASLLEWHRTGVVPDRVRRLAELERLHVGSELEPARRKTLHAYG